MFYSIATLEASKLNTVYEASVKRKNNVEKNLIDATVRGEDLEMDPGGGGRN